MKKQMFLLVLTVSAIIIPSKSTECEQRELEARCECCIGVDADTEEVVSVVPRPEYEPDPIQIDAEDTWISEEYQWYCEEIGRMYNICPELLMAMIEQKSSGDPKVANGAGDTGLLQVNAKWHRDRMEKLGVTDLTDAYSNILVATDYLAQLFEEEGDDLYLVLMKYNMKHDRAEELYNSGIYSEYATTISQRAWELEVLHEQKGDQP